MYRNPHPKLISAKSELNEYACAIFEVDATHPLYQDAHYNNTTPGGQTMANSLNTIVVNNEQGNYVMYRYKLRSFLPILWAFTKRDF